MSEDVLSLLNPGPCGKKSVLAGPCRPGFPTPVRTAAKKHPLRSIRGKIMHQAAHHRRVRLPAHYASRGRTAMINPSVGSDKLTIDEELFTRKKDRNQPPTYQNRFSPVYSRIFSNAYVPTRIMTVEKRQITQKSSPAGNWCIPMRTPRSPSTA